LQDNNAADVIIFNGKIATQDGRRSFASAAAIRGDAFEVVGTDSDALAYKSSRTRVIDLKGKTVVPGLSDSHTHFIREGLNYNMELRWDGLRSLAEGLEMVRDQARRTPPPQWVRVIGSWTEFQFEERRVPTPDELTVAAPSTPVFITHYYHDAILNREAMAALGYTRDTPDPPGGEIQRDRNGNPTGSLIARSSAAIIYSNLAKGPKLGYADQVNSTLQYMRALNKVGLTAVVDGAGGSQFYPQDYSVISELASKGLLTVRTAYHLYPQRPGHELEDFQLWSKMTKPGDGDDFYKMNGAGELLVLSAADFENFMEPRPELRPEMEKELGDVTRFLVSQRWPFQLHATYDESIERFLNVFEEINDKTPFDGLRWCFVHAETISDKNIERVKKLGGGISIQNRMAFQGEHFIARYGEEMAARSPPIRQLMESGIPLGAGSDAPRVSRYDPWAVVHWLVTGKTAGGTQLYPANSLPSRMEALRLVTASIAWFSGVESRKGSIEVGKLADFAVLSLDYFEVPDEQIIDIESILTVVGGKVVYGSEEFSKLSPPAIPVSPAWSPIATYGNL
jgi:predicted amidohydrolase YtcJ